MKDSTRRSVRTVIDLLLALLSSVAVIFVVPGFNEWLTEVGLAKVFGTVSVLVIVLTAFLTKLKNELEDKGTIPAVFKAPASDGENPVPDGGE